MHRRFGGRRRQQETDKQEVGEVIATEDELVSRVADRALQSFGHRSATQSRNERIAMSSF
jgi:hypothetical protein